MFKSLPSSASLASRCASLARPAQPFASTSAALFSTSAPCPAPTPSTSARLPRKAGANDVGGAEKLVDLIDSMPLDENAATQGKPPSTPVSAAQISPQLGARGLTCLLGNETAPHSTQN